jgi:hypothetical protein
MKKREILMKNDNKHKLVILIFLFSFKQYKLYIF